MPPKKVPKNALKGPKTPFGTRQDGSAKGMGYLGQVPTSDGRSFMTEMSAGTDQMGDFPTLVPTLTQNELGYLQRNYKNPARNGSMWDAIVQKGQAHAQQRVAQGLSPFFFDAGAPERYTGVQADPMPVQTNLIYKR